MHTHEYMTAKIHANACRLLPAFVNPVPEYDETGIKDYIVECNRLGVIPVSYFQRHCHDKAFVMRHHGLGPLGAKAISKPLEVSFK